MEMWLWLHDYGVSFHGYNICIESLKLSLQNGERRKGKKMTKVSVNTGILEFFFFLIIIISLCIPPHFPWLNANPYLHVE